MVRFVGFSWLACYPCPVSAWLPTSSISSLLSLTQVRHQLPWPRCVSQLPPAHTSYFVSPAYPTCYSPHLSLFFYHFLTIKPTTLPSPHQVLFGSLQFEAMNQRVVILDQEPVEFVIEWRRSRKSKGSISPPNSSRPILTRY